MQSNPRSSASTSNVALRESQSSKNVVTAEKLSIKARHCAFAPIKLHQNDKNETLLDLCGVYNTKIKGSLHIQLQTNM